MNRDLVLARRVVRPAFFGCLLAVLLAGLRARADAAERESQSKSTSPASAQPQEGLEQATFAAGCFWCSEAVFKQLKGIKSVVSGYSGGRVKNPSYEQVFTGFTGHAESVQITFDPKVISYTDLLEVFWQTHDPTTLNRQGVDVGTQYRSAIFYHTDEQKRLAEEYKQKLNAAHAFDNPVVTEITEFSEFFPAENYHQNYYQHHSSKPYCREVIRPKINKVKKVFHDKLKTSTAQSK